jgi:hypothetical protein
MIKKTFTYENFAGDTVTKDFYFHLSKADFVELALGGDWEASMQVAIKTGDKITIFKEFKRLISMAIGVRSENGEDFTKPTPYRDAFMNSPAFDELIMELFTSDDMGTNFILGCLPANMQGDMQKELDKIKAKDGPVHESVPNPFAEEPAWIRERRVPSKKEFAAATNTQKMIAFQLQAANLRSDEDLTGYTQD